MEFSMKYLTIALTFFSLANSGQAGTAMKYEGSCSGTLRDNSPIRLNLYSDFDGCKNHSQAAFSTISAEGQSEKVTTGERKFVQDQDIYEFEVGSSDHQKKVAHLAFANTTGNTSVEYQYYDEMEQDYQTVTLMCEVRDYEYPECP
jgi:hypothetical protein